MKDEIVLEEFVPEIGYEALAKRLNELLREVQSGVRQGVLFQNGPVKIEVGRDILGKRAGNDDCAFSGRFDKGIGDWY